jgi:hypothetical protein
MSNISSRVDRLESQTEIRKPVFLWHNVFGDETCEDLIARHLAAHPEDNGREITTFSWLGDSDEIN